MSKCNNADILCTMLASFHGMFLKVFQYKFILHGENFCSINKLLKKIESELFESIDEIGEIIRQNNNYPDSRLESLEHNSLIKSSNILNSNDQHVLLSDLHKSYITLINFLKENVNNCNCDNHLLTDILTRYLINFQKNDWLIRSHISGE